MNGLRALVMAVGFVGAFATGCAHRAVDNPWAKFKAPAMTLAQTPTSIGTYSAGCLQGAVSPPPNGRGFQLMRLSRARFYGHPRLLRLIDSLGQLVAARGWGSLLIGDLAQARGGPMLSGHRSHQTGLDVDIWFLIGPGDRVLSLGERESWSAQSMVASDGITLRRDLFTPRHAQLLRDAAESPEVDRVFVHAAIKKHLCENVPPGTTRSWLRKIRPWWGHDYHYHVRLSCLEPECQAQEPLPPGEGCDAALEWWFSEEARAQGKAPAQAQKLPELPAACNELLKL